MSTVQSILNNLSKRVGGNTSDLYPFVNLAIRTIAKRLYWHNSDVLRADLSLDFSADDTYEDLPTGFWGLMGKPYIDGKKWLLLPSPSLDYEVRYTTAAQSKYYRVKGNRLYLFPPTSSDITVKGSYFAMPTEITATDDTMPYDELFDDAIGEALVRFYEISGAVNLNELTKFLNESVDFMVAKRGEGRATEFPEGRDGIDWDELFIG